MLVHEATQSLILQVPDPFAIRDLIPQSRTLTHPEYNIAVKHTVSAVRVLANIGIDAPTPADFHYDWPGKYKPFDHQREMVAFYQKHKRCFNLSEMGTGKTAGTLWAADALMKDGAVRKALILSPLSTLERVWKQDIFDVLMHRVCSVVHGSHEKRMAALEADADFYVINHDGICTRGVAEALRKRTDIDLVIVDEGSMFRNASTQKWKTLAAMLRPDQRLWWLTGTPCPNAPTDAWAQVKVVNPNNVPTHYGSFRRMTMMQMSQFKWAPKSGSQDIVHEAMQPAIRFKKSECLDLPPVVIENRQAQLTKEQRSAFETMKNEMIAEAKGQQITAVNAADKLGKLRQILCGAIKVDEDYVVFPHAPRLAVTLEAIEQASAKVLVVVPFKGIIQVLAKEIAKDYSVGVLNGDVSIGQRNRIIHDFKNGPDPHVLLCHPKVMAHGLNLTEADTLVVYAPIYSNDEFEQLKERFNRAGQTRKMTIIRIGAHPIEWEIYKLLDTRRMSQESILDLYQKATT